MAITSARLTQACSRNPAGSSASAAGPALLPASAEGWAADELQASGPSGLLLLSLPLPPAAAGGCDTAAGQLLAGSSGGSGSTAEIVVLASAIASSST